MSIIRVFPQSGMVWHFSLANDYQPDPLSMGWDNKAAATRKGINAARVRSLAIEYVTGAADRRACGELNVKYREHPPQERAPKIPPAIASDSPAPTNKPLSAARRAALAAARAKRECAVERKVPEGYRSIEHFLDCVRERMSTKRHGLKELSLYLHTGKRTVTRWVNKDRIPLQPAIEAMALWMLHR